MPKHDAFSPKAIANRQKLKGLQRLRWYCQMCQKQCRDENGFKCHTMSEGHLRQMRLFAQNPNQILDSFSSQFEKGFMQILSHSHGTKRVFANRVYQEYIADKNHVHMNSTVWTTLTGFCKYLGKEGKCIVDETEKGWYIQYIDRDPQTLMKQQQREERKQLEVNEDEIQKRMIENQIKAAFEKQREREEKAEVQIENDSALVHKPIQVKFNYALTANEKKRGAVTAFGVNDDDGEEVDSKSNSQTGGTRHFGRKAGGAIELLMKEQEDRKRFKVSHDQQRQHIEATISPDISDTWLMEGILVKIIGKKAYNGDYYKQKGSILDVTRNPKGGFEAEILFSINGEESNKIFSESDLETVVPKVGEYGLLLKGELRGTKVKVIAIHIDSFNCDVELAEDELVADFDEEDDNIEEKDSHVANSKDLDINRTLKGIEYEDISKVAL